MVSVILGVSTIHEVVYEVCGVIVRLMERFIQTPQKLRIGSKWQHSNSLVAAGIWKNGIFHTVSVSHDILQQWVHHRFNNYKPRQDTIWIICIGALRHIIDSESYSSSSDSLHFNYKLYHYWSKHMVTYLYVDVVILTLDKF